MIRFENIDAEIFKGVTFEIKKGASCKIITNSDFEKNLMLDIALARLKPSGGKVYIFDRDIYSLPEKEAINIFKSVGVVWRNGGMISNLKVWENILLPAWYHKGLRATDFEDKVIGIYKRLGRDASGLKELMGRLPGDLPVHEKMLAGLIRAVLMEPDLMIFDSVFEGLDRDFEARLTGFISDFHSERKDMTSVYVTSDEESLKGIRTDIVLRQKRGVFIQ